MNQILESLVCETIMPEEDAKFCDYIEKCNKLCFQKQAKTCQINKFYNKYGINYREEIGSKI